MSAHHSLDLTSREIDCAFSNERWSTAYPPILTVEQASALAQVPKGTIYTWSSQGLLSTCSAKAGKHLRIWRDRFIQSLFRGDFVSGN